MKYVNLGLIQLNQCDNKLTYILYFIKFWIRSALFICVLLRLGPDLENSIYGLLSLWKIALLGLNTVGKIPVYHNQCLNGHLLYIWIYK